MSRVQFLFGFFGKLGSPNLRGRGDDNRSIFAPCSSRFCLFQHRFTVEVSPRLVVRYRGRGGLVIGIKKVELQGKVDPFRSGVDTKKKRREEEEEEEKEEE